MSAEIREVSQRTIDFYCVIILTIDSRQLCTLMRDFKKTQPLLLTRFKAPYSILILTH